MKSSIKKLCCGRPLWFRKWIMLLQTYEWANETPVHLLNYLGKFPEAGDDPENLCDHFVLGCGIGEARDCALWIEKTLL